MMLVSVEIKDTRVSDILNDLAELEETARKANGEREAFGIAMAAARIRQKYQNERRGVHE